MNTNENVNKISGTKVDEVEQVVVDQHPYYPTAHSHYTVEQRDLRVERAGVNLSWRSVFAGLLTFLALSILFSLIGAAIGLGVTDLTAAKPLEGVGTGLVIWTIISFIISVGAGGFVAGMTANRAGLVHGFLTWAMGLVAVLFLATSAIGTAFNAVGSLLGVAGNTVADVATTAGDAAGQLTQSAFDAISENLSIDTSNLDQDIKEALEASDIPELQPNYLQAQLDATVTDIQEAAKAVLVDGKDAKVAFEDVYANIEERVSTIGKELDEDKLADAIAKNTDLTKSEAQDAIKNIKASYAEAQEKAEELLTEAEKQLNNLAQEAQVKADEVVEATNDAMNETSKYSIYAFIGLVLAAALAAFAGKKGAEVGSRLLDGATEIVEDEKYVVKD